VYHSGSCNGFIAWTTLLPDRNVGFVILANAHRTGINFALHLRLLDAFLGRPPQDWSTIVRDDYQHGYLRKLRAGREEYLREHRGDAPPSIEPARCVGAYESDLYGRIVIEQAEYGSALRLRFGPRHLGRLKDLQNSLYLAEFENPLLEDWAVTFTASSAGPATAIHVVAAPWALPWYEDAEDLGTFTRIKSN
jgi:hypothetical protein